MVYHSIEDIKLVLEQPHTSKKTGIRDKFFIALLYDSRYRDQEILDLKVKDLIVKELGEAELHVLGKGRKYRITPITKDVASLFREYCKTFHTHLFRRSRAIHVYMAGIPQPLVTECLRRSNLETTRIYAQATMEIK